MNKLFTKITSLALGAAMMIGVGAATISTPNHVGKVSAADATVTPGTNGSTCTVNSKAGVKVGTSKKGGDLTVTVGTGATTLTVYAAAWNGVTGLSLNLSGATTNPTSISLTADSGVSNNSPFTLSGNEEDYKFVITLSNITAETSITFTTSSAKRFVLWNATYDTSSPTHTHTWVAGTVHAPTCTQSGYTEYSCSGCGDTKQDDFVDPLGHNYVAGTVHAPTCTEAGYTEYTCSRCGDIKHDDVVPATGHNYVDGVCTVCGAKEPNVVGTYAKVTDLSQLINGAAVIITNADGTVAMGEQANNNRTTATGAASANAKITISDASTSIQVFEVESYSTNENTIVAFKTINELGGKSGYLYAAGSGNNYLRTQDDVDANAKFYITLDSNFTVVAEESTNRNIMRYNSSNSCFSCYSSGQNPVALYIMEAAAETYTITYNSNGGTGTMEPTVGASPVVAACTFTAPTGLSFISWNDDPNGEGDTYAVGTALSQNVTLYAIWGTAPVDPSEYFTQITSTSDITDGKYLITYGDLCFDGSLTTLDASQNTKSVGLENLLTSYFTIDTTAGTICSASGKYIGNNSNSNALATSDSADLTNTISIDDDGYLVVVSSGGAYLRYNASSGQERFRYYKSSSYSSQKAIQLYKVNLGATILGEITCNAKGTSAPTGSWSALENYYNTLSTTEKNSLKTADADEGGNQLAQALAKYDYIMGKYNPDGKSTTYKNFLERSITPVGSNRLVSLMGFDTNSGTTIIIIVSVIGVSALGGFFFLRKRKEI